MWIERSAQPTLIQFAEQFKVLLVTGPRQSGKTSILTHVFPHADFVTLDDPAEAARAQENPDAFLGRFDKPTIIDEVQYAPLIFRHLKVAVDRSPARGRFLLTGSQSFPLMHGVTESLAGRAGILELPTLSAHEVRESVRAFDLKEYVVTGGFPVLHAGGPEQPHTWYPSYVATYLERDVRNVLNVSSLRDYARFLRAVAARTGTLLSYTDIARDVGVSPNTARSWLSVLQASGLVCLLEPYFRNVGKRLVKSPKLYMTDTGLACHLTGIRNWNDLERSPLAGRLWETYAFTQIRRAFLSTGDSHPPLWFWRTKEGREVDFIIERGGRFRAFEAKLAETATEADLRGVRYFEDSYGKGSVTRTTIICTTKESYPLGPTAEATNGLGISVNEGF